MNIILALLGGIVGRMIITSLGASLIALNVPPETASKLVELVQSMGPAAGSVVGLVLIGAAGGWSYYQKHKAGLTQP